MPTTDPRIDAYIANSADFAQPILTYLRQTVHEACPEVEETMKWSFPHFMYKGMFCSMASFKAHCAFGFWKAELVFGEGAANAAAMGQFGRLSALADLPPQKALKAYLLAAMKINDAGTVAPSRQKPKAAPRALSVPDDFMAALKKNKAALTHFDAFSASRKREYVDWLEEAKTEATRLRRLETALEWIAEGKARNWKYAQC
ncbi:MAG: YdeI/OmpD-associated family protein [Pseudomonadota bacterium]